MFYHYFDDQVNQTEAKSRCESYGLTLARIKTEAESEAMKHQLPINVTQSRKMWIDLKRTQEHGDFFWGDGTKLTADSWSNFVPGEPNDYTSHENCVEVNFKSQWHWNDIECRSLRRFVCQGRVTRGRFPFLCSA